MNIIDKITGNVSENNACWNAVESAIKANGVDVPEGTPKSEYAEKVNEVYEAGKQAEYNAFWDAFQKNGNRTSYYVAFYSGGTVESGWNDVNFKPKYKIKPTNAQNMLVCALVSGDLTEKADIDFSNATNAYGAISFCESITKIGVLDLRKISSVGIKVVHDCPKLETIEEIIFKDDGTQYDNGGWDFVNCSSLKNVKFTGVIPCPMNFKWSAKLSKESITSIINALSATTTGLTVTFNKTAVNNAFATATGAADGTTSQEWADLIATKSNWTISLV